MSALADDDGIVCLPGVGGEEPAYERLRALLAAAYGDEWSPARQAALLAVSADREFIRALGGQALTLDPKTGTLSKPGLLARLGLG